MRLVTLATCNLNQFAMDIAGNTRRVYRSIVEAKKSFAAYRVGPELEITGYSCEDHFLEEDTCIHAWEALHDILVQLESEKVHDIVIDIGMPVMHRGVRYNCRVFILNNQILLIRPKTCLANDGNYRETRYFTAWPHPRKVEEYRLPENIRSQVGTDYVPFGDAVLEFLDTTLASETCEELFTPASPHISLALNGVEIFSNGSGSHHQLRKLDQRIQLIESATRKCGGVYLYANQRGCDGTRLYFDGCACAMVNGEMLQQGDQFGLKEVEVLTVTADLDAVSTFRGSVASLQVQMTREEAAHCIKVPFRLCTGARGPPTRPVAVRYHAAEEEIAYGPACWLWDYLRRSGGAGFLLPLSGGADSSATAAIVGAMSQLLWPIFQKALEDESALDENEASVVGDLRRILGLWKKDLRKQEHPEDYRQLAGALFSTVYLGTTNSSKETCDRSALLAEQVGSQHLDVRIDTVVAALVMLFTTIFPSKQPRFKVDGGTHTENLALQNIQARVRMVVAFLLAQLLPWVRGRSGFLLVLGSANVDEGLRGYLTKYDCSSADINPIGGVSKADLRRFLIWGSHNLFYPALAEVEKAPPTAELEPLREGHVQTDEEDMGMSYEELTLYGRLRKVAKCGPVSMYRKLRYEWMGRFTPLETAAKVKKFFFYYSMNRHKMTTITPAYHAENYSPDDNRFDLRQFLYNIHWPFQFKQIDKMARVDERRSRDLDAGATWSYPPEVHAGNW